MTECVGFWECTTAFLGSDLFKNLSFMIGVLVAVVSVLSARNTAKKKQSADLLFNSRNDEELVQGMRKLAVLHEDDTINMRTFAKKSQNGTEEAKAIRYVLNHYEYVSVGVQSGIYDEKMLRNASYNTIVNLYKHAKPFIEAIREESGRSTLYQEFQWLAKRWETIGHQPKRRSFWSRNGNGH